MAPSGSDFKERIKSTGSAIRDALTGRSEDTKPPEYLQALLDTRGTAHMSATWLATVKQALDRGDADRCRCILETFLESEPNNLEAQLLLVQVCQQLGPDYLDEAIAVSRLAVNHASNPVDRQRAQLHLAVSLALRARVHTRQQAERCQDRSDALQLLEELVAAGTSPAPSSPSPASSAHDLALRLYLHAVVLAEHGAAQRAAGAARAALQRAQQQGQGQGQLGQLCLALLAMLLSSRQQHKAALSVLSAAPSSSSPTSPSDPPTVTATSSPSAASSPGPGPQWTDVLLWRLRSRLRAALADPEGALTALAHAKRLLAGWMGAGPEGGPPPGVGRRAMEEAMVTVWCELAVALAESGQAAEAMVAVDAARALAPWSPASLCALGAVYDTLGRYDPAVQSYSEALALDPTHAPTLLRLGGLYGRRRHRADLSVARDLLSEALRYDPASAAAWFRLGRVTQALQGGAAGQGAAGGQGEAEGLLRTAVQLAASQPVMPYDDLPLQVQL